jgi:DNA repair exonuclease SbcCD ATPase subunit
MPTIRLNNIGPIEDASFNLDEPGVFLIEGAPGSGKTTALETIQFVVNGQRGDRVERRDGASRGLAEVAGRTIRISKTTRSEGELRIDGLGDFSIAALHHPPFKEPETCDRHRIKALAVIAGAKIEPESFYPLLGGKADFRDIVPSRVFDTDDPVEMTSRVKAAIEEECRRVDKKLQSTEADAKAQFAIAEGCDLMAPFDEQELQKKLEVTLTNAARVKEKREAYEATVKAAEEAKERLALLPPGKSVSEAAAAIELAQAADNAAVNKAHDIRRQIAALENALEVAEAERQTTKQAMFAANDAMGAAKNSIALRGELDAAIAAAGGAVEIGDDEVDDACEAVREARKACSRGLEIRQALKARETGEELRKKATVLSDQVQKLREAAKATFEILSDSIAKIEDCPVRVAEVKGNPRLVVATDRDEKELFSDLSDGEQLDVIMRIAVRNNRLIPMSQAQFGELAPSLRDHLHALAVKHGAYVITAEATDGPLTGRRYVPEKAEAAE